MLETVPTTLPAGNVCTQDGLSHFFSGGACAGSMGHGVLVWSHIGVGLAQLDIVLSLVLLLLEVCG